jgi:hypothetical protein
MEFQQTALSRIWMKRVGGPVLGALGGFAYYHFVGCTSGTCPITSNPWASTAYGALIGLVMILGPAKGKVEEERASGHREKL